MVTCKKYSKLHDKIKDVRISMLTVVDEKGKLKSMPLTTVQTDCEGNIWFFVEMDSEKVECLNQNPNVNLSYADSYNEIYVSISGRTELVTDRNKITELWKPNLEEWLPGRLNNPKLGLLNVHMVEAEYWDSKHAKMLNLWDCSEAEQVGKAHRHHITLG